MPRKTPRIQIPAKERETLERWANSRILPRQTVDRAKMILDSGDGKPVQQIAQELGTYPNRIIHWRQQYEQHGMEGLHDKPRAGRPPK